MRTYGRKQLKRYIDREINGKSETRDAIIWEIVEADKVCKVKIQNSGKYIYAHYPRNRTTLPNYCRVGNAVRIIHKGGNRGYVEIAGEGRAAPSGIRPVYSPSFDAILSGMLIKATNPATMFITIEVGTYRIDGIIYAYAGTSSDHYVMDDDPIVMDDDLIPMNDTTGSIEIETAPADGYWRYDAVVIGIDGVIDIIKGLEVTSNPGHPVVPEDHLILCYILVEGSVTSITQEAISSLWTEPNPTYLWVEVDPSYEDGGLVWTEPPPTIQQTAAITVTIYDQHGMAYPGNWTFSFNIAYGSGILFKAGYGQGVRLPVAISGSSTIVTYRRPMSGSAASPYIQISIEELPNVGMVGALVYLYDENGIFQHV